MVHWVSMAMFPTQKWWMICLEWSPSQHRSRQLLHCFLQSLLRNCWYFDLRIIRYAFTEGNFTDANCRTLICFFMKIDSTLSISQFRSISLCKSIYKILTNVLVYRLRPFMSTYIGHFQSAFIMRYTACGNDIILQEVLTWLEDIGSDTTMTWWSNWFGKG